MKAMILAAGLGTRLRPLTIDRPKALVKIAGRTLLEITLARLLSFGIRDVIINVHHLADLVVEYLRAHDNFGMNLVVSREDDLLDTGGGLKKAAPFFLDDPDTRDDPFVLHNVDVLSSIDLRKMAQTHAQYERLATLAVQRRETSRYLLFDSSLQLCGRRTGKDGQPELVRETQHFDAFAFSGIHIISPRLLTLLSENGAFSIIPSYLRLAAQEEKICAFRADDQYWRDLGKLENHGDAEKYLKRQLSSAKRKPHS
jgi:NDP-sugar pyrophosphorylase family protein